MDEDDNDDDDDEEEEEVENDTVAILVPELSAILTVVVDKLVSDFERSFFLVLFRSADKKAARGMAQVAK